MMMMMMMMIMIMMQQPTHCGVRLFVVHEADDVGIDHLMRYQ